MFQTAQNVSVPFINFTSPNGVTMQIEIKLICHKGLTQSPGRDIELFSLHFFISLPQVSKSFPQVSKSFPQDRKSFPQDRKSLPQVSKSFPQVSKVVPTS